MPYVRRKCSRRSVRKPVAGVAKRSRPVRAVRSVPRGPTPVLAVRQKWSNPIPQDAHYKFRYSDEGFSVTINNASGYRYEHLFAGNGPYDPDVTGAGVQPYGWDQVAALFPGAGLRVLSSSISISYVITSETASAVRAFVLPARTASLTYTDRNDLLQIPGVRHKDIDKTAGLTSRNYIKNYCATKTLYKYVTSSQFDFTGTFTGNPVSLWLWYVIFDTNAVDEDVNLRYDVDIVYYTVVSRVNDVNES